MRCPSCGHENRGAARMEQIAEPGTILLAEPTAALVSGYFALRDLGLTRVRGVQKPVRIFALKGAGALRTRFDVSRARGLTRFVGRDGDLQALEAALESARQGHGQVVGVVGEAGLGKSRLCFALGIMRTTRTNLAVEPSARLHLAEAYAGQGDAERARRLARETVGSLIEHGGNRTLTIYANLALARVLQRVDGAAAAGDIRAALDRAETLVDETGAETMRPFVHRQRAELARLLGDEAGRRRELAEAERLFAAMGAAENAAAVARELGRA